MTWAGFVGSGSMSHQDWDPVVVRGQKSAPVSHGVQGTTGKPAQRTADAALTAKLLHETDIVKLKQLSHASRQDMIAHRVAKKMTQIQLNQMCGFPAGTVNKIENGQLIPAPSQLSKINRALQMTLRTD